MKKRQSSMKKRLLSHAQSRRNTLVNVCGVPLIGVDAKITMTRTSCASTRYHYFLIRLDVVTALYNLDDLFSKLIDPLSIPLN